MLNYYEDIESIKVNLSVDESEVFSYASTSNATGRNPLESAVAFGELLRRDCVDVQCRELVGKVNIDNLNRRYFLKITACLVEWQKRVCPLLVKINDKVVYDKKETLFEQVYLGWPSIYIELPTQLLNRGENKITLFTESDLYVSELWLISFPAVENLNQISNIKYVKKGDKFGVAVKDVNHSFENVLFTENCNYIKSYYHKDFCVLTFESLVVGNLQATVSFGRDKTKLIMPQCVENEDDFLLGMDSDDHRQDDSDETDFIVETAVFSGMGNFIQFRPKKNRNYYNELGREEWKKLIELIASFGLKYGASVSNSNFDFLPNIKPENFLGYHIHETYLFFNYALNEKYIMRSCFEKETQQAKDALTFGQVKNVYLNVLNRSKQLFSKDVGLTSFGSASLLCVHEGNSDIDRINIEPVSNLNLLTGAVRATSVKSWGAHVPVDWYFGVPVDKVKSNKYRLAMQYLYLNGASLVYTENSLFKTKAFERCDWESEFCKTNRRYLREFYDYVLTHPRKGRLLVDKAIVYGINEFCFWKLNDRMAELKDKDWDMRVWGKWDNKHQIAWNASEAWLPVSDKQNVYECRANKNLFSGTPYGNVDIVSAEKDFSNYSQLVFLGWNTMTDELLKKLKDYVNNGGTLMISYAHFNYTDVNDKPMTFPHSKILKDFIGVDLLDCVTIGKTVQFEDKSKFNIDKNIQIAVGNLCGAKPICVDENANGVVYKNHFGKGKIYFVAFKDYVESENDTLVLSHLMKIIGREGDIYCDNKNLSFTVRETDDEYRISVLNMNCLENADESFNITFKGYNLSSSVKVGEIKDFVLKK